MCSPTKCKRKDALPIWVLKQVWGIKEEMSNQHLKSLGLAVALSTQTPSGGADEELEGVDSCVRQKSSSLRFKETGEKKVTPDKVNHVEKERHV